MELELAREHNSKKPVVETTGLVGVKYVKSCRLLNDYFSNDSTWGIVGIRFP